MAVSENYKAYILEQLEKFGDVEPKNMFGGVGLFKEGLMFGMIQSNDTFRLRVDESNQADYVSRGMKPFTSNKKGKGMPYWEVPAEVLDDSDQLKEWAKRAFDTAVRAKKK